MKKEKIKIFVFEILLIIILFFALFASNIFTHIFLALVMGIYALLSLYLLKRRKVFSINKTKATILMIIFSMFYLGIFYLFGLYFGFVRTKITFSFNSLLNFILPIGIIIVSSETIRRVFLSHKLELKLKEKTIDFSPALTYASMVIVDLLIYTEVYNLTKLDDFLAVIGYVLFASLSCNLLYNYITVRYGSKGVIFYRLITVLFIYIFPIIPDMYIFFKSFLRMFYPYIIYLTFEKLFSKNDYIVALKDKRREVIKNSFLLLISALLVMLISCQFKYGIIVVGSESMTGTLNKGDGVVFEKYEKQEIKEGQVIIFDYDGTKTIHRVIDIKRVNGEYRYYTKGDANKRNDDEYRIDKDIYALVKLKVKYVGYPTLWLRDVFS